LQNPAKHAKIAVEDENEKLKRKWVVTCNFNIWLKH
jgi:hypothetical protein